MSNVIIESIVTDALKKCGVTISLLDSVQTIVVKATDETERNVRDTAKLRAAFMAAVDFLPRKRSDDGRETLDKDAQAAKDLRKIVYNWALDRLNGSSNYVTHWVKMPNAVGVASWIEMADETHVFGEPDSTGKPTLIAINPDDFVGKTFHTTGPIVDSRFGKIKTDDKHLFEQVILIVRGRMEGAARTTATRLFETPKIKVSKAADPMRLRKDVDATIKKIQGYYKAALDAGFEVATEAALKAHFGSLIKILGLGAKK